MATFTISVLRRSVQPTITNVCPHRLTSDEAPCTGDAEGQTAGLVGVGDGHSGLPHEAEQSVRVVGFSNSYSRRGSRSK